MALEMKVHKEITAYEPKPMFGQTWRRLGALAIMLFGGGGLFAAITFGLMTSWGQPLSNQEALSNATNVGMYAMFVVILPAAAWAWLKPMGLKPEIYAQYALRHQTMNKVILYDDTYPSVDRPAAGQQPEPLPGAGGRPVTTREQRRAVKRKQKAIRKAVSEHRQEEQPSRRASRQRAGRSASR